jgi:hypothetical protein
MLGVTVSAAAAWINVAIFALAGMANLVSFRQVREMYERWDIPPATYRIIGLLQIFATVLLASPAWRGWGVALAAPIVFGWVIMLLDHRQYLGAAGLCFALVALAIVFVASPSAVDPIHYMVVS